MTALPVACGVVSDASLKRAVAVLVSLCAVTFCGVGCILLPLPGASRGLVEFSSDSSVAASVWVDNVTTYLNFEGSLCQTASVRWCRTDRPDLVRSVHILSVGLDYSGYQLGDLTHLSFSPDSHHLAVAAPYMLKVVDLADGRCWRVTPAGEIVSSLVWFGSDEIGYAAHTSVRGRYRDTTDRTFWRQRIHAPPTSRVVIHREEGVKAYLHWSGVPYFEWPLEHWSPGGRYVLYQPTYMGRMQMLDVQEHRARAVGAQDLGVREVAWKNDESVVACMGRGVDPDGRYAALLVEAGTLSTVDFASPLVESLKDPWPFPQTAWTPDGRYLLINDLHAGGCLIQPVPFRCVRIGDRLPSHLGRDTGRRYMARIHPLPIAGWVRARYPDGMGYVVDYEGQTIIPLGKILADWSEDGTVAGQVGGDKQFHLQHVQLPPPATRPALISTSREAPESRVSQ